MGLYQCYHMYIQMRKVRNPMEANETTLSTCLFFTANRLANVLRRIVNDVFAETEIATPHVYLLIVLNQYPGITISELSEKLDVAPSTCTRFVNALVKQGILQKKQEWKTVHLSITSFGKEKTEGIDACLKNLHERCKAVIGEEAYQQLSADMWRAANQLDHA